MSALGVGGEPDGGDPAAGGQGTVLGQQDDAAGADPGIDVTVRYVPYVR